MTDTDRINALDVERPCNPPTTHRYRRVGQLALLCCVRCGQGKSDIVGVTLAAPAEGLDCGHDVIGIRQAGYREGRAAALGDVREFVDESHDRAVAIASKDAALHGEPR